MQERIQNIHEMIQTKEQQQTEKQLDKIVDEYMLSFKRQYYHANILQHNIEKGCRKLQL